MFGTYTEKKSERRTLKKTKKPREYRSLGDTDQDRRGAGINGNIPVQTGISR